MRSVAPAAQQMHKVVLRSAQTAQALVLVVLDHLATKPGSAEPRPIGRLWRMQLDAAGLFLEEPLQLVDQLAETQARLLALNTEFLHRVVEAMDSRDPPRQRGQTCADVVPIDIHRRQS